MITKIVCASIGAVIMLDVVMVIACCKITDVIAREVDRWSNDE